MNHLSRKALVVVGGGLRGAYTIGVLRRLYDYGGPDQFAAIYTVSVGVFACTFFAAHQVETMEYTWRHYVHGSQLINYLNPLCRGRAVLDLDYLVDIFRSSKSFLDLERVAAAKADLFYGLTDYLLASAAWFSVRQNLDIIFDLMRASSALPAAYHKQVWIKGRRYVDGGLSDPLPVARAINDGYHNLLVVLNRPRHSQRKGPSRLLTFLLSRSPAIRSSLARLPALCEANEVFLEHSQSDPRLRITVIRPETFLDLNRMTRERDRIIKAIEIGKADAERVLTQAHW